MGRTLGALVVGTGYAGTRHVDAVRALSGAEIVAVVASSDQRAREASLALGLTVSAEGYKAALRDDRVDVVHVCTPNDRHAEVVEAALRAGKHVICEKPLATDVETARALAALARGAGTMTVLAHNYRFFPLVAELRERIRAGELGRIHLARGHFLQDRALRTDVADWRIDALRGGASRAIADVGSHWLDLAEVLTGRLVASVVAQVATIHPIRAGQEVRTEDQAALLLRFAGGLPGSLVVSQVAAGRTNEMEISLDGDRGSATWRQHVPDELWLAGADGSVQIVGRDGLRSAAARELATAAGGRNESRRNLVRLAYQVIRGSHASDPDGRLPTFADGAHQLSITAAALESARTGLWVDVDEPS